MELKDGRITILAEEKGVTIKLHDHEASITFAEVALTSEQFTQALSRLGYTKCAIELTNLKLVGKAMVHKVFKFRIPNLECWEDKKRMAHREAKKVCPEGWKPDLYFEAKDSFFEKNGKSYAKTTIRQWI